MSIREWFRRGLGEFQERLKRTFGKLGKQLTEEERKKNQVSRSCQKGFWRLKNDHDVMNLRHDNRVEIVHEHEAKKKNCDVVSTGYLVLGLEKLKIGEEKVQTGNNATLIQRKCLECLES